MENILPRREARENAFLLAFSQTFGDVPLAEALTNHAENDEEHPVDGFSKLLLNAYYDHSAEVDDEIRAHLRNWTMERLPRVSLTVLRLAIAEMLFGGENKPGVAINEAVQPLWQFLIQPERLFVQKSGFFRSNPGSWACGRAMHCSTTPRHCRKCCTSLRRSLI